MRIYIFPIFQSTVETAIAIILNNKERFYGTSIYGIVPEALYVRNCKNNYLLNEEKALPFTLITLRNVPILGPNDLFIKINDYLNDEQVLFSKKVEDFLINRGYNYQAALDSVFKEKERMISKIDFIDTWKPLERIGVPVIGCGAVYGTNNLGRIITTIKNALSPIAKISTVYATETMLTLGENCIPPDKLVSLPFDSRVRVINHYVKNVVQMEKPDAILIEIPGGLMKMDDKNLNGSGENAFLYSQALSFDYFICSIICTDNDSNTRYSRITNHLTNHFDYRRIIFHLSNKYLRPQLSAEIDRIPYVYISEDKITNTINQMRSIGVPCYNLYNKEDVLNWYNGLGH